MSATGARPGRSMRTDHSQSLREVFRVPLWLGLLSAFGLLSALIGDDVWDVLSWLALLAPVAVAGWYWHRRDRDR